MYKTARKMEEIEQFLDSQVQQLEDPYIPADDIKNLVVSTTAFNLELVAYLKSNYSEASGPDQHNFSYWYAFLSEMARGFFITAYGAMKTGTAEEVVQWASLAATASLNQEFVKACDGLISETLQREEAFASSSLFDFFAMNPMSFEERIEAIIEATEA